MKLPSLIELPLLAGSHHIRQWLGFTLTSLIAGYTVLLQANPSGMTVVAGTASAQASGAQLNITTSQAAFLSWSSFNIQPGETTTFLQPSANSVVLNEIGDANPSQIFGNLNASGTVILANANGFYFGPNSMIKVGGDFIATTAPITPDFGSGSSWTFTGMPPLASIVNYGQIQAGQGRSLFLIAENIQNDGSLNAPGGNIGLAAGQTVLVSERPDGRGLSASVEMPAGSINNLGQITADAGTVVLQAQVVNQNGIIQADSIQNQNGVIELVASDQLNLGANSQISANGDDSTAGSSGGTVTLQSGNNFSDSVGSQISARGGAQGGNGGSLEISAPNILSLNSTMDATAQNGWSGGTFFLDPANITLGTSTANGAINVNTAFAGFSQIDLQASGNITLNAGTTWDLSASTGNSSGQLTLQAGGDILFQNNSKIIDANDWSVTLEAGYDFVNDVVQSGVGNIYLNNNSGSSTGGGWIQTAAGAVTLIAGQSILVGSGSVSTTGGGSIFANALAGDINAGSFNGGTSFTSASSDYSFSDSGATPNTVLGGISTGAGGDVTLIAGNNITSTPTVPAHQSPGASGAYGSGDVTVIAGNQITGNFNLANGAGTMLAGVTVSSAQASVLQNPTANPSATAATLSDLQTAVMQSQNVNGNVGAAPVNGTASTAPVTLSLISGAWNVWAANDISIKEVNNPNGAFNVADAFQYDYAPDAAANFWAGNAIELIGANLGRLTSQNRTPIYAPSLSLDAGAGGIKIDTSIILAPSSEGSLSIVTRDGGDLSGAVTSGSTVLVGITMSDSASSDYTTFASEHDNIHLDDPNSQPVYLDISGDIDSFSLTVPTFANITVQGNTYNFGFQGQNLSPSQTTSINVLGDITYRGDLTSETLSSVISLATFNAIISGDPALTGELLYDDTTGTLSFVGVMSSVTEQSLLNPVDANNNAIFTSAQLTAWQAAIAQLYIASQTASLGDQGLSLTGPGNFNVSANSIDLGVSGGIRVLEADSALESISPDGADLNVTTLGDLTMTATKISNESYLGDVNANVGGTLDVGGEFTVFGDANSPKGIFTTSGGNVNVTASGDVNVDGSRIAAYNGGSVTVESLNGNVNAGTGGAGYVSLNALELDPVTGQLDSIPATIPGSGILATTVSGSYASLGNILVEAPNGNLSASQGGIVQVSFNGSDSSQAIAELLTGYELQDTSGHRVLGGNLQNGAPVFISAGQDIDTGASGVIAQNIIAEATGEVQGLFVGFNSVNLIANIIGAGVAYGQHVSLDQGSGPDVGSPGSPPILVISDNPSAVNGNLVTATAPETVPVAKQVAQDADDASTVATKTEDQDDTFGDDENKKKGRGIALAQKVSRVTLILPSKKN